jgi:hypothetical protein
MITGLDLEVFKEVRSGTPTVNLSLWWWTKLPQSYLCGPCSDSSGQSTTVISRHDEALLLYLSQKYSGNVLTYKPPGKSRIEDTYTVVQRHANCSGHGLSCQSWSWVCSDGNAITDLGYSSEQNIPVIRDPPKHQNNHTSIDLEKISQSASKECTRRLFWWLGQEGIAWSDRLLFKSLEEWIGMTAYDDDDDESDSRSSEKCEGNSTRAKVIKNWLKTQE